MIACHWFNLYGVPVLAGIAIAFLLVQNSRLWLRAYQAESQLYGERPVTGDE